MKIIHILAGKANPNTMNGVNKVVHSLATEQKKKGHEVSVFGVAENKIKRHNPNYILRLFTKNSFFFLPPLKFLKRIRREKKKSIVHLHSAFISWFLPLCIYLKILGFKKIVLTPHGAYTPNNLKKSKIKKLYFFLFESIVLRLVTHIHLIGQSEVNKYSKNLYNQKYSLIPNGCYLPQKYTVTKNPELIFGYLGRLKMIHKGLDIFLCGFLEYKNLGGKGVFEIVGDGPDKNKLINMVAELGLNEFVKFLGVKYDGEKDYFFKKITYFVHTSRWEGLPTATLEASSYQIPLLISKETNMGEIVNKYNAGIVLHKNEVDRVKIALFQLEKIFFEDNYKTIQNNVKKMVTEELLWSKISDQIINEIYE